MKTIIAIYVVSVILVAGLTYLITRPDSEPDLDYSGVTVGNEYNYVKVSPSTTGCAVVKARPGALGSLIVSTAGAGRMVLYDATTTNAALRGNVATTSLAIVASVEQSQAAGTYIYDTAFNYGLIVDYTGTQGTSTITYR